MKVKDLERIKELIKNGDCTVHAYDREMNEIQVNKTKVYKWVYAMFDEFEMYTIKDMFAYESENFNIVIRNYEFIFSMFEIVVYYN